MDDEKRWIRDIQHNGSRRAADQLVRAYYDEVFAFVYRQTGEREDAKDLTQDIFIAVLRSLPSYDSQKATFRTWLYRVAANKVIDARRRSRPGLVPLDEIDEGKLTDADNFTAHTEDRILLEKIENYVSSLEPRLQTIFRLHIYGELSFPQIAAALNEPEATVKARYYRLIGRLRKEFGDYEN